MLNELVAPDHPLHRLAEETLAMRQAQGPVAGDIPDPRRDRRAPDFSASGQ